MKNIMEIRIYNNPSGSYIQVEYADGNGVRRENFDTQSGIKEIINFVNSNNVSSVEELLDTVSFVDEDGVKLDKESAIDNYYEFLSAIMNQKVTNDTDSKKDSIDYQDDIERLDVVEVNYYKYGNDYVGRFVFADGTYKLLSFSDANKYLELLINEGVVDKDFVDNNVHFYRTVDDDKYIEVDFQNFKSSYTTLDIKQVIINSFDDSKNDYVTIVFNNGETSRLPMDKLDSIMDEYSELTGLSKIDLFDNEFIIRVNNDEKKDKEDSEVDDNAVKDNEEKDDGKKDTKEETEGEEKKDEATDSPKKSVFGRIRSFILRHPLFVKIVALLAAIGIGAVIYNVVKGHSTKENPTESAKEITEQTDDEFANYDYNKIVAESGNAVRVGALSKIHDYMVKHYVEGVENRDADIEFEPQATDIMAYYLAYNKLDQENIDKIFGNETIDYESMKVAIKNLVKHDAVDHTMQKNSLGKDIILNSNDAKELYNKYEKMFIKINKSDDDAKKVELLTKFNDEVRKDLPYINSDKQNYDGVEAYMYIIREFSLAAKKYNLDVDNSLTSAEEKYIEGIYDKVIEPKLIDIVDNHNNNYDFSEVLDGPSYSLFMKKIQEDYASLFDDLYIPDEEEEEKEEKLEEENEDEVILTATTTTATTTSATSSNTTSSYNSGVSYSTASSSQSAASTSNSSTTENEEEVENIYDDGYNKKSNNSKKSKKKQKAKDVNIKNNSSSSKRKDVDDVEDIEDINDIEDTNTSTNDIEDIENASDIDTSRDGVTEDISVQDVQIEDVSDITEDTSVQDVEVEDVQDTTGDEKVEDVQISSDIDSGVDVETVEDIDDVVTEVNENEEIEDTNIEDKTTEDIEDTNVEDTTKEETTEDITVEEETTDVEVQDVSEEDTNIDDVLTADEIADTIVEIMASEEFADESVEDIEVEDSYQYTR